jgi:hypothetical protein
MIIHWELLHKNPNLSHIYQICFKKLLKYWFILLFHHIGVHM